MNPRPNAFANLFSALCIAFAVVLATSLQTAAKSAPAAGIGRHFARTVNTDNAGATDTLEWYCDESILYDLSPRTHTGGPVAIPTNATASWVVLDPATSNAYICANAVTVTPSRVSFFLPAGSAALPRDTMFESYVLLLEGTNLLGIADHAYARCLWSPLAPTAELTPTNALLPLVQAALDALDANYASTNWVAVYVAEHAPEPDLEGYATQDWVTNDAHIMPSRIGIDWCWRFRVSNDQMGSAMGYTLHDFLFNYMVSHAYLRSSLSPISTSVSNLRQDLAAVSNAIPGYAYNPGGYAYPDYITPVTVVPSAKRYGGANIYDVAGTSTVCNVSFETRIGRSVNTYDARAHVVRTADPENTLLWEISPYGNIDADGWIWPPYDNGGGGDGGYVDICAVIGSWTSSVRTWLEFNWEASGTNNVFIGPAPGSLLEDAWGLYENARTNVGGSASIWRHDEDDDTDAHDPDFWAGGATNFAWMSIRHFNADRTGDGFRPLHLVTPQHVVMASHFRPNVGSTNVWIGEDGSVVLRKLVDVRKVFGDVAVGRLDEAIPESTIRPAAVLRSTDAGYFYGDTNGVIGKQGWPVLAFDSRENAWFMWAKMTPYVNSSSNRDSAFPEPTENMFSAWMLTVMGTGTGMARSRHSCRGGDSGSAVCLYSPGLNGGRPVLLGLYQYATAIPQLASLEGTEWSLQAAIDAIGNPDHYSVTYADFSGWSNPDIPPPPAGPVAAVEPEP